MHTTKPNKQPTIQASKQASNETTNQTKNKFFLPLPSHPFTLPSVRLLVDLSIPHLLVGLVVKESAWRAEAGSNPACAVIFPGSSHTSDSIIGTVVAALPGAWRYRVSAGTGRPGVSILWLGEVES